MSRSSCQTAELTCPRCGQSFAAALWLIVDADERPDLRAAILRGSIHDAACPHCGAGGAIKAPLLYHDPAAARLIAALPMSVGRAEDAQALVEDLAGQLIASLPTDERHPYLCEIELV